MTDDYRTKYLSYLDIVATVNLVEPHTVDTIIHIESSWNPWAVRYEKYCKNFDKASESARRLGLSLETELNCQKTSFGLGQIMGGTARTYGFTDHLTKLLSPEKNIDLMCKILAKLQLKYPLLEDLASAYNGGSVHRVSPGYYANQEYVDKFKLKHAELWDFWHEKRWVPKSPGLA